MIGGTVVETIIVDDKVWINCKESPKRSTTCAIYVDKTPEACSVSEYDMVWWQGGYAFWTPRDQEGNNIGEIEVKLSCRGCSGVSRPVGQ